MVSEPFGGGWQRVYMDTDLVAWVSHGSVNFSNPMRAEGIVHLGRESDWAKAPLNLVCGRRNGHYFARVLQPTQGP